MKTKEPIKCPTCGGDCRIEWSGLDLVENTGDETLATKHYISISDQQNKEKDAEIQRLKERNKYLEEHSNERFEQANELNDKDQEIQRLTKQVEELGGKVEKWVFSGVALHAKNTRLRELLERCRGYLEGFIDKKYVSTGTELLTEIDNALNHKP